MPYAIEYAANAVDHLQAFTRRQQNTILDGVDKQLMHEPTVPTRNRKQLRPNPLAPWEFRIGNFRVYDDVQDEPQVVSVLAVGVKSRNRVLIGGEEIEL